MIRLRKAQLSIELLLLLAVLFAFLLALAPIITKTQAAANLAASTKSNQIALETISSNARQAYLLGNGAQLEAKIVLKTPVEIVSSPPVLEMRFSAGNVSKSVSTDLGFELSPSQTNLENGVFKAVFSNTAGKVSVVYSRIEAQPQG
ncbi:MAG: hypothetical protein V1811_01305 [Candidatus Micrarchaeota archaeon]